MDSIELELQEKNRQRTAFLCEVYKRTKDNHSKYVSYDVIRASLNFPENAIERARLYLEHEDFIETFPAPYMGSPQKLDGRTLEGRPAQKPSHEKLIFITDKGISCAQQL